MANKTLNVSKDGVVNISLGATKRELVTIGHRLGLVKDLLNQQDNFAQALKAERAMRSIIDAIVEVGHMLDGGIDKLTWR
jgi:hypothetical protein